MNTCTAVTADQAAVIRQFIAGAELTNFVVPNIHALLQQLGYKQVAEGIRVAYTTPIKVPFGSRAADLYKDEYHADWETFTNAEIAANSSASESPESDKMGNILREEV